jgi:hypothetical protein
MLSTRDVLLSSGTIHSIWKLGIHDDAMTPDMIESANLPEIAREILQRQDQFVFKITSILLRGVTTLYFKKTSFLLLNCQAVIERISLKFQPEPAQTGSGEAQASRVLEIDEETVRLWQAENNLEAIVADERREEPRLPVEQPVICRLPTEAANDSHAQRAIDDDDFGVVPFVLENDPVLPPSPVIDAPPIPDDDGRDQGRAGKVHGLRIDESPLIPITEISALLEDGDTVASRRQRTIGARARSVGTDVTDFANLFRQAREIAEPMRPAREEIRSLAEADAFEDCAPPMPPQDVPPPPEEWAPDIEQQEGERDPDATFELFPIIAASLDRGTPLRFNDFAGDDRRQSARRFFSALCLHNRGILRLTQSSWQSPIVITRGPRGAFPKTPFI